MTRWRIICKALEDLCIAWTLLIDAIVFGDRRIVHRAGQPVKGRDET